MTDKSGPNKTAQAAEQVQPASSSGNHHQGKHYYSDGVQQYIPKPDQCGTKAGVEHAQQNATKVIDELGLRATHVNNDTEGDKNRIGVGAAAIDTTKRNIHVLTDNRTKGNDNAVGAGW